MEELLGFDMDSLEEIYSKSTPEFIEVIYFLLKKHSLLKRQDINGVEVLQDFFIHVRIRCESANDEADVTENYVVCPGNLSGDESSISRRDLGECGICTNTGYELISYTKKARCPYCDEEVYLT